MRSLLLLLFLSIGFSQVVFESVYDSDWNDAARQSVVLDGTGMDVDDLMIVVIGKDDDVAITDHADWTQMTNSTSGTGNAVYTAWRLFESGDTDWTFTSTDGNEDWWGVLLRFTGHDTSSPIHASEDSTATSDAPEAPDVAYVDLTAGSTVVYAFGADDNDVPYTSPSNVLEIFNNNVTDTGGAGGLVLSADSYISSDAYEPINAITSTIGQSTTGNGDDLSFARFRLEKFGSPTGTIEARLYSHSGTYGTSSVPDALLATSDSQNLADMPASYDWVEFTFSGDQTYTLGNGTYYCIAVHSDDCDGTDGMRVRYDGSAPSHGGNFFKNTTTYSGRDATFVIGSYFKSGTDNTGTSVFGQANSEQWVGVTIIIEAAAEAPAERRIFITENIPRK